METTLQTTTSVALTPFERHVKQALKYYDLPGRLGEESPLASHYFLGRALRDVPRPITAQARGEVLRAAIRSAAARLWGGPLPSTPDEMLAAIIAVRRNPDDPRYAYVVLELRCFGELVSPQRTSDIWELPHLLPGSKSQHYRDFDEAVKRLAAVLLDLLRPALRPEQPRIPEALYGYGRQQSLVVEALKAEQTVTLTGPGGMGKTSLGAAALAQLSSQSFFWYTIRPGFNDGVGSLLFGLGALLHEQGASNLWQYLVSTNGIVQDLNLAAGLLRQDLESCAHRPVLCFDDLEHLATGNLALLSTAHTQLLDLIDGLRGIAPLLLISQRPLLGADLTIDLAGLSLDDIKRLWHGASHTVSQEEAQRLLVFTGGNPRLLKLMLTLRDDETHLANGHQQEAVKSLLPAFIRLWRRLAPEERRSLQHLAVFQGYAPEDAFEVATLESLARLGLIERDGEGGVALLAAFAPILRDELSSELRETLHGKAAVIRLERGEYTAAAYHFAQSKQESRAIQVWFPQRQHAIARGEADAARSIFLNISRQRLDKSERKALDLIRAELRQLAGQYVEGLQELERVDWLDESEAHVRLWTLRGELEDALGFPDRALSSYAEGLQVTARLLGRQVTLHQRRGLLFHHRRNLEGSWQEIHRAEFELEALRGLLREEEGVYDEAAAAYGRARALADQLDDDGLRAQAERRLAAVCGRRGLLEQAVTHAAQSIAIYERLGDRANLEKMRSNLSAIYVQTSQFQQALVSGQPAYAFFTAVRDPYYAAVTAANLAEASYGLGDLDEATHYARAVIELGQRFAVPYAHHTLGQVDLARGDLQGASANFARSMQAAQQNADPYMAAYAQRSLGQALAATDREAAQEHIRSALSAFQQLNIPSEIAATEQALAET